VDTVDAYTHNYDLMLAFGAFVSLFYGKEYDRTPAEQKYK
jgi:hypothetical protein